MYNLGFMHQFGMYNLGFMHQYGIGLPQDFPTLEATTQPSGMRWPGSGAAPPLWSAGETTAGTTLPSVSVPPIVGSKTREQRVSDVTAEIAAGRMPMSGYLWSKTELLKLMQAVDRHGRDWAAVSLDVGSKTNKQCKSKVQKEVGAGRMQEPGGKEEQESWSQAELVQLKSAVDRHGRD